MAFSRVSRGDSDMPSSWDMKDEPKLSHCREIVPSCESRPMGSIQFETENTGSLSYPYC